MLLSDFDFHLPESSIALFAPAERSSSRLLVLKRKTGSIIHGVFADITSHLNPGDLLLLNDTRVIPARLKGKKATGGKAELLLIERTGNGTKEQWRAMARPAKDLGLGAELFFDHSVVAAVIEVEEGGNRIVEFSGLKNGASAPDVLGVMPLPPYIKRQPEESDKERYQTVYAKEEGAIAAPTAGLHFTPELIEEIEAKGVTVKYITLHVGPGTFMPVRVEDVTTHRMLKERYSISPDVIEAVEQTKAKGKRVVAVGTTTTRAVEGAWKEHADIIHSTESKKGGGVKESLTGATDIFIYPGFKFCVVDALITNFHLPRSTLIMLVSAFAGKEKILAAYKEAVDAGYRFYSYGDAMIIE